MSNGAGTFEQWLVGAGLGAHSATFAANGIDLDIAFTLNDADLRELGLNLGDRKRFLSAIARPTPTDGSAPSAVVSTQSPPSQDATVERRQLTILFCDLVGSTSL